jgi:hypothetical protein
LYSLFRVVLLARWEAVRGRTPLPYHSTTKLSTGSHNPASYYLVLELLFPSSYASSLFIWKAPPKPPFTLTMTLLTSSKPAPYTPGHKDLYDSPIDAVGRNLHPLPYRNGDGASVLGPRNKAREQQEPDVVRPPGTDHGTMKNMKWSFADSHSK